MMDQQHLTVKTSTLPGAGKGLFTEKDIKRGSIIIEYLGTVNTWKEVKDDLDNPYLCYINKSIVINAAPHPEHIARYANDAAGPARLEGLNNNCFFERDGDRVFLKATKLIKAGGEIFVSYGKDYWQ